MSTRTHSPKRILVIAAHPDDEVLGCGGTIALHARAGSEVYAAIACEGESLRYGPGGVGQAEHMQRAADTLGVRAVRLLGFPDQRLETKIAAMACYESELRAYPHPRSLEALRNRAKAWGNQSCMEAAEVFMTVRQIHRHGQTPP